MNEWMDERSQHHPAGQKGQARYQRSVGLTQFQRQLLHYLKQVMFSLSLTLLT